MTRPDVEPSRQPLASPVWYGKGIGGYLTMILSLDGRGYRLV
jgi:hypothetical protein